MSQSESQHLQLEEGTREAETLAAVIGHDDSDDICSSAPDSWIGFILYWFIVILLSIGFIIVFVAIELTTYVLKKLIKFSIKKKVFLLLCMIAIILDPLFFYIPVINNEKKCIEFDENLEITSTVLRSVFDFLKLIHVICLLLIEFRKKGRKQLWLFFLLDILTILPIPQVLLNLQKIKRKNFFLAMSTFFLLQYLLRIIRTYFLFTQATGVTGILAEATWAIVAFNVLLYMQGSHVFGALWYFFAIRKAVGCWKKACISQTECSYNSFYCDDNLVNYRFLNDFCLLTTENKSNYDFGLYTDALQSGIGEMRDFPKKLLHCLQWGLQNLSAFGQNLRTSGDVWENIFAICMTNFGVVLFVFLIGRMQSDTARSQKIKQKWKEIEQWPNFGKIHSNVQGELRKYKRKKWQETKRVDIYNLVNDLPEDLGKKIRRQLCLELLKKVNQFKYMREKTLAELCDYLIPVFFIERTRIVREGDPIDEMLFVLKGKLWTSASRNVTTTSLLIDRRSRENHLEDGDFCGQELIAWALNECSSSLPTSTRTIQALTNVDAFILMADDLKYVLLRRRCDRAACLLQSRWRKFYRAMRSGTRKSGLRSRLKNIVGCIVSRISSMQDQH